MNADKILPILCRYIKDTDNRLLARLGLSLAIMLCYSIDDHEFCFVGQHIFVALRTQNFFVTSIKFD